MKRTKAPLIQNINRKSYNQVSESKTNKSHITKKTYINETRAKSEPFSIQPLVKHIRLDLLRLSRGARE